MKQPLKNPLIQLFLTFIFFGIPPLHAEVPSIEAKLRQDLANSKSYKSGSFVDLISLWEKAFGTRAVPPLLHLAYPGSELPNSELKDHQRYICLMAATKLGGKAVAPILTSYLKDPSWMIRSGALRALQALGNPEPGPAVLPLVNDPSLIVRKEAIETLSNLQPPGWEKALLRSLEFKENYHHGKALWAPQAALRAIKRHQLRALAPSLRPLLLHFEDPELQREVLDTLTTLVPGGPQKKALQSLHAQVLEWEKCLRKQSGQNGIVKGVR